MRLTRLKKTSAQTIFKKIKQHMTKNISTNLFIFSMIIILLIGGGFFIALHFFVNPLQNPMTALNYQPVTTAPVSLILNLSSPDDNLLVFDPNLLVSGQTTSSTLILITINNSNQILNSSQKGDFSLTIKLQPGNNQVIVSAFDNLGNYKSEARSIYYSEEKL